VAVLKTPRDLQILLEEGWYRIPLVYAPKRRFTHLAFYQPAAFGPRGKRIERYARVRAIETAPRRELLPSEPRHERAGDIYLKCFVGRVQTLARPICNIIPRRVSFGFTDLATLRAAGDILELYHVPRTEQILAEALALAGIQTIPEHTVTHKGRRVRIDLAIIEGDRKMAIECDNRKAHAPKVQQARDRRKDAFLRRLGWRVLRFHEEEILARPDECVSLAVEILRQKIGPGA